MCSCGSGFQLANNGLDCDDIDECNTNNGGCAQNCTNTEGSFVCSCRSGYQLASNGLDCDENVTATPPTTPPPTTSPTPIPPVVQIELLPRMINVTEGQDFSFEVVKQSGFSFGAIPFWILPLTYAQFEARNFSLDELFPMRPPSAASEGLLPAIMCVTF